MPSIFLRQNKGPYKTGTYDIEVSGPEIYQPCELFLFYRHKLNEPIPDEIGIFNEKYSEWSQGNNDKFTLKLNGYKEKQGPLNVDVYFNKFDSGLVRPLLFVVYFGGDFKSGGKYYKYSEFSHLFNGVSSINLSVLIDYKVGEDEKQLLQQLLTEDEKRNDILIYRIDKQVQGWYNNDKIFLSTKVTIREANGDSYGFCKNTHTPKETDKRSCVMYNDDVLKSWTNDDYGKYTELSHIQNEKYTKLTVYWSDKLNIPLMVECVKKGYQDKVVHSYYFQTRYKHKPYWRRLYNTTYEELLGEQVKDEDQIQSILTSNVSQLLRVLEKIEFLLINSIIILLEQTTSYGETSVEKLIKNDNPQITLTSRITEAQPDPVNVVRKPCKKLEDSGYLCYRHSFSISQSYESGELRLMLPSEDSDKYTELKLYSHDSSNVSKVLYYEQGHVEMYVYFYQKAGTRGGIGDPRPLLLIYEGEVYKPLSLETYNVKWVRLNGISASSCDNFDDVLINTLSEVVGFLNIVNLDNIHKEASEKEPNTKGDFYDNSTYSVQKFNGQGIDIRVTYENKNCYRVYTYTPGNTNGYRLGLVTHGRNKMNIQYPLNKQLKCVLTYYSLYDFHLEHPVLVELRFSETDSEYFILKINDGEKGWEKLESYKVDKNNIEKSLYQIRTQLGISFRGKNDGKTLFDPKNCNENKNRGVVLGLLTGLTLLAGGAGLIYYKLPHFYQYFYRRFY
ncbi:hypothetical protein MACK_001117 [Theileria orientalis]|uniref:Uncharacterized protein n=1 Tax=Theileria orientalis TaxID=68886 RepID=A0A976MBV5_THEOR|nr:hypothetical protein MACK_001117 [Theileria orientalis]